MRELVVLVDKVEDWQPYFPTEQIVKAKDYLISKDYQTKNRVQVLNLCQNIKYLSMGYYCSLLAEARQHKVMPTVKVINDLSRKKIYLFDVDELQNIANEVATKLSSDNNEKKEICFRIFFGETKLKVLSKLGKHIFDSFQTPLLEVSLIYKKMWRIDSIEPIGIRDLEEDEEDFFANRLEKYSTKIWRSPKGKKQYLYDLAVLVDPDEKMAPSDEKALELFQQACQAKSVYCEFIQKKDFSRLSEFDALFIRATTAINNFTYQFAKAAEDEGVVVIDDSNSILKCTNKIYLSNLLERHNVPIIPSHFVSNCNEETLNLLEEKFGFPMVLKIPDGSFSIGVKKVKDKKELEENLKTFLKKSALVLVQQFFFTDYDWRIGVLNSEAIYACKYYMSKGHWQIYNHDVKDKKHDDFSGNFETFPISEVPAHVLDSALRATKLIGNSLYGVDLKDDGFCAYVVEVNDNPNLDEGIENKYLGKKLYDLLVDEFIKRVNDKKQSIVDKKRR